MVKNKIIGITGSAGLIGTTLSKTLCEKYSLKLYDIKEITDKYGEFFKIDLANKQETKGIFNEVDALIHLAADPRPDAPRQITFRNNFIATSNVFDEAYQGGVKKIIFASSNFYHQASIQEILQGKSRRLITLDTPPTPLCPYGESKVFGEYLGLHYSFLGIQFVALRIGWTVPEDTPKYYPGNYMRALFCSKRDLVQAFEKALEIKSNFLAAFAVSNNTFKVFDLKETKEKLGYNPQDNSENY